MPAITVDSIRLSLLWLVASPDAVGDGGLLGTKARYVELYDQGAPGRPDSKYVRPWPPGGRSRFWAFYLSGDYHHAEAALSWDRLVPLRVRRALHASGSNARLEQYTWPHAAASVLTVDLPGPAPLNAMVDRSVAAARTDPYDFGSSPVTASQALRAEAAKVLGDRAGDGPDLPFSVATVVAGSGRRLSVPEQDEGVWRAVFGLACLSRSWRVLSRPPVEERRISAHGPVGFDGGLYGVERGRTVWLPRMFASRKPVSSRQPDSLLCYHRNLVDLAMQVEAQLALLRWARPRLMTRGLTFETRELVRRAAQNLARLYAGERPGTYASMSAARHMADDDVAAVQAVWDHYGILLPSAAET